MKLANQWTHHPSHPPHHPKPHYISSSFLREGGHLLFLLRVCAPGYMCLRCVVFIWSFSGAEGRRRRLVKKATWGRGVGRAVDEPQRRDAAGGKNSKTCLGRIKYCHRKHDPVLTLIKPPGEPCSLSSSLHPQWACYIPAFIRPTISVSPPVNWTTATGGFGGFSHITFATFLLFPNIIAPIPPLFSLLL